MKFEKKESRECAVELVIQADVEKTRACVKKADKAYLKRVVLPGFRKGNVPLALVKKHFEKDLKEAEINACYGEFYPQALHESGVKALQVTEVRDVKCTEEEGFSCVVEVEVAPTFELPQYKGLTLPPFTETVTEENIDTYAAQVRASLSSRKEAPEGTRVTEEDYVEASYVPQFDDETRQAVAEHAPKGDLMIESKDARWIHVKSDFLLPALQDALLTMKVGETKADVVVVFPDDFPLEVVRGKSVTYCVTIKSARVLEPLSDEDLLKRMNCETMDALRAELRKQLQARVDARKRAFDRNAVIESLMKGASFAVPQSVWTNQTQSVLQEMAEETQRAGLSAEELEAQREKILKDAQDRALAQVRLSYILMKIVEAEKITVSEEDVTKALTQWAADSYGRYTVEDCRKQLQAPGQMNLFCRQLAAEKAVSLILDAAQK